MNRNAMLNRDGYERYDLGHLLQGGVDDERFSMLSKEFDALPADPHATGPGRFRRFGRAVLTPGEAGLRWLGDEDANAYLQHAGQNPEFPGVLRRFPPLTAGIEENPLLAELVAADFVRTEWTGADLGRPVVVGVHLIKLVADEPGRWAAATPDALHQDGEPYTFAHLFYRRNVRGGNNVIARPACAGRHPRGVTPEDVLADFTLTHALDSYGVKDDVVSHYVAPITAEHSHAPAERAILLIDFTPVRRES